MYDELKNQNFELIAAAQDTGGEPAAGKFYDRAKATFTTLIDREHVVSTLYHLVNVPSGVWIDEEGRIVRPGEVAYTTPQVLGQAVGGDRYVAALRDWVARGAESPHVLAGEKLQQRLPRRGAELARADAAFRLGVFFHEAGREDLANRYWEQAQSLNPESWNYHRQDWSFTPKEAMRNWMRKFGQLKGKPYYAPLDLPEVAADPDSKND